MKFKNTKKVALALGTVATIAAPIAAVVSCGGADGVTLKRYDLDAQSEITIQTTFSNTGYQFDALNGLVKQYNKTQSKVAGFKKVKLVHVEGGYGSITPTLKSKFLAQDKSNAVPNMIIDYADAAGALVSDFMQLDMTGSEGQLSPKFLEQNNKIGGNKGNKTLWLPISESAEMVTIDQPLLKFLVENAGGTVDGSLKAGTSTDFATDHHGWKDTKEGATNTLQSAVVNDATFDSYDKVFDLIAKLAKSQGLSHTDTKRIMGLDSPVNALYEMAAGAGNYDEAKALYKSDGGPEGYLDYTFLKDNKSDSYKAYKTASDTILKSINNGALKLNGGGSYTSSDLTRHMTAIAIGSTAGYSHNYLPASGSDMPAIIVGGKKVPLTGADAVGAPDPKKDPLALATSGSYHNPITTNTKGGSYDTVITAAQAAKVKAFLTSHTDFSKLFVVKGNDAQAIKDDHKVSLNKDGTKVLAFVDQTISGATADLSTVQATDVVTLPMVKKVNSKDSKGFAFVQGPGLMGVHHNAASDKAVNLFAKWFTSTTDKSAFEKGDGGKAKAMTATPLEYWAKNSEYLVALKGNKFFGKPADATSPYTAGNFYASQVVERITDTTQSAGYVHVMPASDDYSSHVRADYLQTTYKGEYDTYMNTGKTQSTEEIYSALHKSASIDHVI